MMRMNITDIAIMIGGVYSTGAPSILVEEGTAPHQTMTGIATQITFWSLKHWRKFQTILT